MVAHTAVIWSDPVTLLSVGAQKVQLILMAAGMLECFEIHLRDQLQCARPRAGGWLVRARCGQGTAHYKRRRKVSRSVNLEHAGLAISSVT